MDFIIRKTDLDTAGRTGGGRMTTRTGCCRSYFAGMIPVAVVDKVFTVTIRASPTTCWHGAGLAVGGLKSTGKFMTGRTGVMDQRIGRINCGSGGIPSGNRMTGDAAGGGLDSIGMIGGQFASSVLVTFDTIASCGKGVSGLVMNRAAGGCRKSGKMAVNAV